LTTPSRGEWALRFIIGGIATFVIGALLLAATGHNPAAAFSAMLRGSFGSRLAFASTLDKAVPIGLCAIGISLAYRGGLWNIGAEGQLYFGAFAAAGVGLSLSEATPHALGVSVVLLAGFAAGAAWAALAAAAKVWLGVNEILSTLMLNYVAILWVDYLVSGPWADPVTISFPFSPPLPDAARLPPPFAGIDLAGVIALVAAAALFAVDRGLRWGYELRISGDARRAAAYGGIRASTITASALVLAGALAGLAGAIEVAGATGRLQSGLSPGYGFIGILVAWLARGSPLGIVLASIVYAGLLNGGFSLQVSGVPSAIGTVLQAVLLLCILTTFSLGRYRLRIISAAGETT
jgi:general nucleoside transport system permease protein